VKVPPLTHHLQQTLCFLLELSAESRQGFLTRYRHQNSLQLPPHPFTEVCTVRELSMITIQCWQWWHFVLYLAPGRVLFTRWESLLIGCWRLHWLIPLLQLISMMFPTLKSSAVASLWLILESSIYAKIEGLNIYIERVKQHLRWREWFEAMCARVMKRQALFIYNYCLFSLDPGSQRNLSVIE